MLDVRRGSKGVWIRRRLSNSTPRKKEWLLISCAPPRPRRFSVLQMRLVGREEEMSVSKFDADQAIRLTDDDENWEADIPSNEILSRNTQLNIIREVQALSPVHNLPIGIVAVLGAERRPTNETFEHDGAERPPVAVKGVAVTGE